MTKILQIVGTKKSGKTTTMIDFISVAKSQNLKVVCLKRAHEAVMDTPRTDSFRLAAAGADAVGLQVQGEFLWHEKTLDILSDLMNRFITADTDLLLLEGFRSEKFPRLQLIKADWNENEDEERLGADFYATIFPENDNAKLLDFTSTEKRKDWFQKWLTN